MKIIFFDMDDVLCTMKAHDAAGNRATAIKPLPDWRFRCAIDADGVAILNEATNDHTRFVSCSTWRMHMPRESLEAHLRRFGWRGQFHEDWATPILNTPVRGREISAWLKAHPEIASYAIVDDNPTAGKGHEGRFCHIERQYFGLTRDHLPEIMKALAA